MFKVVIALALLAHGIGHSMGLLQLFKVATINPQWNGDSWLLSGVLGTAPSQFVGGILWTVAIIGFAALAGVVVGWLPADWFDLIALGSAVVSLLALLLFPVAFPPLSAIAALVVDVAVLAATVWFGWRPDGLGV